MHLPSGTLLKRGEYRIISTLGRGGFGITYIAEQVNLHRKVCIKEFFPKDYYKRDEDSVSISLLSDSFKENMSRFKSKFIKEAQTIAALDHANIIHIHDVFEENGTAYYVMDYVDGESLSARVKSVGTLSERDAVGYIKQVAAALEYIHDRNINHLDVKPGNIMVRTKGDHAILIDFGLSKHYYDTYRLEVIATRIIPVSISPGFTPIELYSCRCISELSPETDIYSLGATLYFLVTGNVPPQAADIADDGMPELPAHLSSSVRTAIERSIEVQRKRRPHSIKEFMAYLNGGTKQTNNDNVVVAPIADSEVTRITESDERTLLTSTRTYKVGDYYNVNGKEGVVFEVTADGRHGKIVSLDETRAKWDSRFKIGFDSIEGPVLGANSERNGKVNTDEVMQRDDWSQYPAFVWCRNKGKDWYLPAKDELKAIYNNESKIKSTLAKYGAELNVFFYWSSTKFDGPYAWGVSMHRGATYYGEKFSDGYVRAVSAF